MRKEELLWARARGLRSTVLEREHKVSMLEALVAVIGADIIDALNKMEG